MAFDYSIRFEAIDKISSKINAINSKMAQMSDKASQTSTNIKSKLGNVKLSSIFKLNTQKALANIKQLKSKLDEVSEKGKASLGKGLGVLTAGAGMLSTIALPIKTATDFNSKMLSVKSIVSGGYGTDSAEAQRLQNDFIAMKNKAQELGSTTEWSASQVAEGMKFMSMAGFKTTQTIDAMAGVLSLATVGEMDLAKASDIASNALSGFGLDASEMTRVSDMMAKTITTSNTTVSMLGESFKVVAPLSKGLGISIEETSAMLGKLGDAGINGSLAGNALKRMMLNLSAPTGEAKKAIEELGLKTFDAQGKFKPMSEQIGMIQGKIKGLSEQKKTEYLKGIFGSEALSSAIVLMGQGKEGIDKYTKALENSEGVGKRIADIQLSGAGGKLKLLQSAFEGLMISIGANFTSTLGSAYEKITKVFESITKWTDKNKDLVQMIGTIVMYVGGFVAVMGVLYVIFGLVSMSVGVLSTVLTGVSLVMKLLTASTWLLNSAFWANPITWIVAGVIALIVAVGALIYYFEDITNWVSNLWDKFTGFIGSLNLVEGAINSVKGYFNMLTAPIKYVIDLIDSFMSKFEIFNQAKAKVTDVADAVTSKVSSGWESAKSFFGFGDDKTKASTGADINNTQKNHTVVDVNVTAVGGASADTQSKSTGAVKLKTVNNGL